MLIQRVNSPRLLPDKEVYNPEGLHPLTRRRCIRLAPIVQYSPLLPSRGVWAVSQSQCGWSPSQAGYPSKPRWAVTLCRQVDRTRPHPIPRKLSQKTMRSTGASGITHPFPGAIPVYGAGRSRISPVRHLTTKQSLMDPVRLVRVKHAPAFILSQNRTSTKLHEKHPNR